MAMRSLQTPLLLAALCIPVLGCAPALAPAQTTKVYFLNDHGPSGVIDVYMDGALMFDNMFSGFPTMFGRDITPGPHTFVVTTYNVPLGHADLLESKLEVERWGDFTLTFAEGTDKENFDRPILTLKLKKRLDPQ